MLGFDNGLVLSTGYANEAFTGFTSEQVMGGAGDADLSAMSGYVSNDAIVLEFDVISPTDTIFFQYLFASTEWNQGPEFDDNFALFVNGQNHALLPDTNTQVSVQTILSYVGKSSDTWPFDSKDIYVDTQNIANFTFPGRTTLFDCNVKVTPGVSNHIKIVIADTSDFRYNSAVFLKGGSLSFEPDDDSPKFNPGGGGSSTSGKTGVIGGSVTFEVDVTGDPAPSLQWQVSTDGGKTWVDVPGATAAQLTLNGITQDQNGNMYRVIAVNAHGTTISEPFALNVTRIPPTGDANDILWCIVLLAVVTVFLTSIASKRKQENN